MSWVNSLSPDDLAELSNRVDRFGATAFELYLILTLVIAVSGPIQAERLPGCIEDHGDLDWHRIRGEFELREGRWHIRQPTPLASRVRA